MAALMAANHATTATVIHPGDVVELPSGGRAPGFTPDPKHTTPTAEATPVYATPNLEMPYIGGGGGGRTEHVSGYTRRDGTYVHSYNRRPRR